MKKTSHFIRQALRITASPCEVHHRDGRDCWQHDDNKAEWCWPCSLRHARIRDQAQQLSKRSPITDARFCGDERRAESKSRTPEVEQPQ